MKSFELKLFSIGIGILVVAIHWSYTEAEDYGFEGEDSSFEITNQRQLRALTPEEEALANDARAHIAKTIENNLVRLFAVISARGNRRGRQDDDDDEIPAITPNPNVLPQVAQILGAIFSGSLNITRVVDQTFGLVPNIVRNQVGGLVKLLTGENMEEGSTTVSTASAPSATAPPPPIVVVSSPPVAPSVVKPVVTNEAVIVEPGKVDVTTEKLSDVALQVIQQSNNSTKGKYRVRSRTTKSPITTPKTLLEDDEIEKLEEDLRRVAREYEPYMRNRDPRGFIDTFRQVLGRVDFNMSDINTAVPSIFNGARRAFIVLDNLGLFPANELLDELGLGPLYAEEEEEEEE